MLAEDSDIEIVGECSNGIEAIEKIQKYSPDLLFLDIEMPEMDGFALLESFPGEKIPVVIFVTAYNQYAVRAFDVSAVDYLLKPFDHERMEKALERAKSNLREKTDSERSGQVLELLQQLNTKRETLDRFVIKKNGRVLLIASEEIDWIEAQGNYVLLHAGREKHILRETMKRIEKRLDPNTFLRIHRSTIVNINRIKELQTHFNGEHLVILKTGNELTLSRRYREKLSQKLGTPI
jgi:two-component system LytT family response regulator